jgi:two-component system response regulator AtoC
MNEMSELMGRSPAMESLRTTIRRLVRTGPGSGRPLAVLIQGETGTGKGLVARLLHQLGPRRDRPFIDVNCAAIPDTLLESELFGFERGAFTDARRAKPGLFQTAHRGTIFLDEIALLPETLQAKLLKVIEEHSVRRLGATQSEAIDVWVISATNTDLAAAIRAGRFRADLYHRLAVLTLSLPPVRERGDDAVLLAEHFLARAAADYGLGERTLAPDARALISRYTWPGNVRQLANAMERATLLAENPLVTAAMLDLKEAPDALAAAPARAARTASLDDALREHVQAALDHTGGNISRTAATLGIARNTLRAHIRKLGLRVSGTARPSRPGPQAAPDPMPASRASGPVAADAPPSSLRWEHRMISILAASLSVAPDTAVFQAASLLQDLLEKLKSFGARIEELTPIGVVAVFGLEPMENAASRAAHAALAMLKSVERAHAAAQGVQARLAIHSRRCLVAHADGSVRLELRGKQAALTELDRLLSAAPPAAIVVSAATARFVSRRCYLAPLASTDPEGEFLYRIVGPEPSPPWTASPFIGRERELLALERAFGLSADGAHAVAVRGDPGMGKSRLLAEFRATLSARPVTWLEGRSAASTARDPYAPLAMIVRRACGIDPDDGAVEGARKLRARLDSLAIDSHRAGPFLRHMLGFDAPPGEPDTLPPGTHRKAIQDAVATLLLHCARSATIVLVLEDVHWIDDASRRLLSSLVRRLVGAPVLLVFTARPHAVMSWLDSQRTTRIDLLPLGHPESLSVLRSALAGVSVDESVVERIVARAAGNPLFLEELGWAARDPATATAGVPIPGTIQEVLQERINRLGGSVRRLLDAAAVLGSEFPASMWEALWGGPLPTADVATLGDLELVRPTDRVGRLYVFRHALIQETVYAALPNEQRRSLHLKAGQALESLYGGRLGDVYDQLAHHYSRSDDALRAIEYLARFAAQAASANATVESVAALQEALNCIEGMSPGPEQDRIFQRLLAEQRAALPHLGDLRRGTLDFLLRQRARVDALGDPDVERSYYLWLGRASTPLGEFELAIESAERAARVAAIAGDQLTEGAAHSVLAHANHWLGHGAHAVGCARRAVELLEESEDAYWLGYAYRGLALSSLGCGDLARTMKAAERLAVVAAQAGSPFLSFSATWMGALAELPVGDPDRALEKLREALESAPSPVEMAQASAFLGIAHVERGEAEPAIALLAPVVSNLERVRQRYAQASFAAYLAEAYLLQGNLASAREVALQAKTDGAKTRYRQAYANGTRMLGRIALASGDVGEAQRLLTEALELFETIPNPFEAARTRVHLAHVAAARGDPAETSRLARAAIAVFEAAGAQRDAARARTLLEASGRE